MAPPKKEEFDPVFGRAALQSQAFSALAKGNLVAARHRYVVETWGEDMLRKIADGLDGPARQALLTPPLPMGWHPMEVMAAIDRALLEGPMEGDMGRMRKFGYVIADYDLSTLYRMLFKVGTPAFVLKRIDVAFRTYIRNAGAMSAERDGDGRMRCTLRGGCVPYYLCSAGMTGWLHAAVVLSGGKDATVEHTECQHLESDACVWTVTWR